MKSKYAWLIYNENLESKLIEINELYKAAAYNNNITLQFIKNTDIYTIIQNNQSSIITKNNFNKPDFVLFLDKDVFLAKQLQLQGLTVFNNPRAIEICDDKRITFQNLLNNKYIKMPKTIFSPLLFIKDYDFNNHFINFVEANINYPLIVKEAKGSFGEQVYLINNKQELIEKRKNLGIKNHLYQEFISTSFGKDVRIYVVGDKVVATILRKSENDFRANVNVGSKVEIIDEIRDFSKMAIETCKELNLDFAGVDILFGKNDEPILCEVNSNAHIKAIYNCAKINIANYIFKHILNKIN